MVFDFSKDIVLKTWKCEETGLIVTINKYNGGEAKVQIGPRILKKQDGSDRVPMKAGRLSIEDLLWFYNYIDEIKDELINFTEPLV